MTAPSDFNSISELDATLVFRVAYDGSSYSGFAEQPGQTTVAGELRRAIETMLRRPIDLTCAGRTDAGVHAVAQYISVPVTDAELACTRRRWLRAMDALLPKDIAINEVYKARRGFSARFDARSRTYTYRIADRDARPVLSRGVVWWHRYPLDVKAMSAACPALLGEQDFKSFCKVASAVGKPKRAMVVWNDATSERFSEIVEHALVDAGFAVSPLVLEVSPAGATLADADSIFGALSANGITCDDLVVAVGDAATCSVVSWCANQWCGRTECALLPTTFDAMLTVATTMKPLIASSANALPAIAFRPEPGLVVCDLDLVREADPEDLKLGYAVLVGTMLSSSKSRWNQFTETVPEILAGEEVALVNAVQWSQTARKDVLMATNPSARHALDFGMTGERTLRVCLGDAASQVPAYQLLSEGMRFEARLAHDACDFDIDYVFEADDCLEDFGIEELAFDLEPGAYIEEFRKQQFARSNRSMLPLPAALGAIRLTNVEDEVLKRHAHAYLASRKELL